MWHKRWQQIHICEHSQWITRLMAGVTEDGAGSWLYSTETHIVHPIKKIPRNCVPGLFICYLKNAWITIVEILYAFENKFINLAFNIIMEIQCINILCLKLVDMQIVKFKWILFLLGSQSHSKLKPEKASLWTSKRMESQWSVIKDGGHE